MKNMLLALVLLTGTIYADDASDIKAVQSFMEDNKILIEVTYDASNICKNTVKILGGEGVLDESCTVMLNGITKLNKMAPTVESDDLMFSSAETEENSITIKQFVILSNNMNYITTRMGE